MRKALLILFVSAAVLAPAVEVLPGLAVLRPEVVVVLFSMLVGETRLELKGQIEKLLGLFGVIAVFAIGASYTAFAVPLNYRDFMVFPMLLQYWLIYSFSKGMAARGMNSYSLHLLAVVIGISAGVGVLQSFNVVGINSWLTPYYLADHKVGQTALDLLSRGNKFARAVGTIGDPRHFAYVVSMGIGGSMALFLHGTGRSRWLLSLPLGGLCILALLLSVSRTGAITSFALLLSGSYLYYRRTRRVSFLVGLFVLLFVGTVMLWGRFATENISNRFMAEGLGKESMETSIAARKRDTFEPFLKSLKNPLILITGQGPSKSVLPGSEHSDIGWVILRYGIVGFLIYAQILYWGACRGLLIYRRALNETDQGAALFNTMVIGVWLSFALAESIFKQNQLMSLNLLAVGMIFGIKKMPGRARGILYKETVRKAVIQ